jgi:prepilin-type N-terminal cleavage/methylation domain-containing protein
MRPGFRSERAFTLVEVLIAMTLMAVGISATLSVFGSSGRTAVIAQQNDVAVHQAQAEVDRLGRMDYDTLGLTATPATSTNPRNPGFRVSGSTLLIKTGLTESFVLSSDTGQSGAAVNPTPTTFSVGLNNAKVTGKVYRYVTWRDENCPAGVCDGTQNTKRITVAVTIDQVGTNPTLNPIWTSAVIPDPDAVPAGSSAPGSPSGSTVTAQDFYLYDTRCGSNTRQTLTGDHSTHLSASSSSDKNYDSYCENTNEVSGEKVFQPDLMGKDEPSGDDSTPLYKYSSELSGTYDGGLAMKRQGTTCPTSHSVLQTFNTSTTNIWSIHSWSSVAFSTAFDLDGMVTLSLFTAALGGASGQGVVCATLLSRDVQSTGPVDTALGSFSYTLNPWPTTPRRISFSFTISPTEIPAGDRLVLVLGVKDSSSNDLYFVYDHPSYPSFLEVATTTPL